MQVIQNGFRTENHRARKDVHVHVHEKAEIKTAAVALLLCALSTFSHANHLSLLSVPAGYTSSSIEVGRDLSGALAQDTLNANRVYVSAGPFGSQQVVAVNTNNGTTQTVTATFGSIGGLAVLANGDLIITENFTSDTIFRAHDGNLDGDFLDPGELTQLIAPILTDGDFTGSQVAVAPAGNVSAIPAGDVLIQTADGNTSSELLVVDSPLASPAFRPSGGAYFSGYQFNGGLAFDPAGNVIFGIAQFNFMTFASSGRIVALVNSNANQVIDSGETNTLVSESILNAGLSDLAVSKEARVLYGENSGSLKTFNLPVNLLTGSGGTPTVFAQTDAAYLSAIRFNDATKTFNPNTGSSGAKLYLVGLLAPFYDSTTNLLIIQPATVSPVQDWQVY